jgi:hypothetical protein
LHRLRIRQHLQRIDGVQPLQGIGSDGKRAVNLGADQTGQYRRDTKDPRKAG